MVANVHDVTSTLNHLIQINKDAQEGFVEAGAHAGDPDLKDLLERCGQQRLLFAAELQQLVEAFRQEPQLRGSWGAALHRRWLDLRSAFTGWSDRAILAECERGEESAIRSYEESLATDLPLEVRSVVQLQYEQIQEMHAGIRELRVAAQARD